MRRLDAVKIQNFRGIREGALEGLADVNVLIGRNNSGKSTVLEAITRCALAFTGEVTTIPDRGRGHIWSEARGEVGFEGLSSGGKKPTVDMRSSDGDKVVWSWSGTEWERDETWMRFLAGAQSFLRRDLDNKQIEISLWERLLERRADRHIIESVSHIYGAPIEQIQLPPSGRIMLAFATHGLRLDWHGDGMRAAFRCLTMLSIVERSLFMIEEPEAHQHPGALKKYAKALCSQARKQDVQLIVTTHSTECIDAFLEAAGEVAEAERDRKEEERYEAAVFHLQLNDGVLSARRLSARTAAGLESTGIDLRELDLYG